MSTLLSFFTLYKALDVDAHSEPSDSHPGFVFVASQVLPDVEVDSDRFMRTFEIRPVRRAKQK